MAKNAKNAKNAILDAVEALLTEEGTVALSVDRIVARAGVSKGAFFHHFETKEEALIENYRRFVARYDAIVDASIRRDSRPRGRVARAHIEALLGSKAIARGAELRARGRALLALVMENGTVAAEVRRSFERWNDPKFDDGISEGTQWTIAAALDGYWMTEALGLAKFSAKGRTALRARLLKLIEEE